MIRYHSNEIKVPVTYDDSIHKIVDKIRECAHIFGTTQCSVVQDVKSELQNIHKFGVHDYREIEFASVVIEPQVKETKSETGVIINKKCGCE